MELFGFIENPSKVDSWTTGQPMPAVAPPQVGPPTLDDPFSDWTPSEVGKKLVKSNVRWGFMAGVLMIALGLVGIGYWLYQQPTVATQAARDELVATAEALKPAIDAILAMDLVATDSTMVELALINSNARSLFEVAGTLPNALSDERSIAVDIAGQSLEGTRTLNDAYAYRSAVVPILEIPDFETDPNLIALDDAAATFGTWQTRFQGVASALPSGIMSRLGDEISTISGELDTMQTSYLDALRTDDEETVALLVRNLSMRLGDTAILAETVFTETAATAAVQFAKAAESIESLLS